MLYLVGSRALKHYGVDLGREPGDYDVYSDKGWKYEHKYSIPSNKFVFLQNTEKGQIVKINDGSSIAIFDIFDKNLWDTDKLFFSIHGETKDFTLAPTDWSFEFIVAPPEILYIMYRTTAEVYKDEKSIKDFEAVKKAWPNQMYRHELYMQRLAETQKHFDKTKKVFFEQHGLKQFIDHDKLHEIVTDAWCHGRKPQYLSILDSKDSTKIDINKFKNLHDGHKNILLAEEICVLLFERFFIYKTVTEGFQDKYVKQFFSNSKQSITTKLIHHVCEKGLKGEHPEIIKYAKNNIKIITDEVYSLKVYLKTKPLPEWFLNELAEKRTLFLKKRQEEIEEIPF
jgi:hypothetical protein